MDTKTLKKIKDELNKQGLFLEKIVFTFLLEGGEFEVRREEPYSGCTSESFEGTIDVLAVYKINDGLLACLPIECKKADPEQKCWVFERRETSEEPTFPFDYYESFGSKINYKKNIFFPSLGYHGMKFFDRAIQSFEFNEATGIIDRNSQKGRRPYYALKQSNEAVSSFIDERRERVCEIAGVEKNQVDILFIPLVVTTANLYTLDYKPKDIGWDGGVPINKLNLEEKKWLHYEFPLPYSLRARNGGGLGPVKRPSFIVNANDFSTFISGIIKDCKRYIL